MYLNSKFVSYVSVCISMIAGGWLHAQDNSKLPGQVPNDDPNQIRQEQIKQLGKRLFSALDELVAGEFTDDSELKKTLEDAANKFAQNDLQGAFNQLQKASESKSDSPPARLMMAALYFATNKRAEARAVLEVAAVKNADYPGVFMAFARIAVNEGRLTDSLALYEKVERLIESGKWNDEQKSQFKNEHLDGLVDVAIKQQRLDDAVNYLNQLGKLMPKNAKVPYRLAEIAFTKGQLTKATEYLTQANQLQENSQPVELTIAHWYAQKNLKEETQNWIEKAVAEHPKNPVVLTEFGKWHFQNQNMSEAANAVTQAIANGGDKNVLAFLGGQIDFAQGNYSAAEQKLTALHQQRPGNFESAHMLALVLIESTDAQKRAKALDLARINVQLNPKNTLALAAYGWIQFRLGNNSQAGQALQQVASSGQLNAETAFFLASLLEQQGRDQEAMNLVDGALKSPQFILYRPHAEKLKTKLEEKLKKK